MKKPLLLVFCKNPRLGKVKTRLAKTIGDEKALLIYKELLKKTASVLKELEVDIHLYYSDEIEENDLFSAIASQKKKQAGEQLGERMANAFQESFISYDKVVIIGTDLWTLETQDIHNAFQALEKQAAVIGPSKDGGYYLLGLNQFFPELFKQKEWGTDKVLSSTLADLNHINYHLLKEKNDVDTFSDLEENPTLKARIQ
ncbi:MAG: TIGR04282 family arsenosugar biosynthesis glycosyltransferase [Candidatus Arcticimaribacter sp.]